ncbi:MAG: hypothetical protein WBA74_18745 [Cyclobacteriaceae bacterium]
MKYLLPKTLPLVSCLALVIFCFSCNEKTDYFNTARTNLTSPTQTHFDYKETMSTLGHFSRPWQTADYSMNGIFAIDSVVFFKKDTLTTQDNDKYLSRMEFYHDTLLYYSYGAEKLSEFSEEEYHANLISLSRYTPAVLFNHIADQNIQLQQDETEKEVTLKASIGKIPVTIHINKVTYLPEKISVVTYDELYGDVTTTYLYNDFKSADNVTYPERIVVEKYNGQVTDSVEVSVNTSSKPIISLIDDPQTYQLVEREAVKENITVSKYNDYIHLIELKHTDDRVLVVEFKDYMLVAEAPLNSKNGELIIEQVRKIAPEKPVKYFVFGHHHPHYLGGLRAFVHKGATILCTEQSEEYVEFIASARHSLQPDSLHLEPKELTTKTIKDQYVLDNGVRMEFYFMGDQSEHTEDYLIYYFPDDKVLFQDDLCWISREGELKPAGARQKGLYNSIKENNLDVKTIIQSWPVKDYGVMTIIPFEKLEKSIKL